LKAIFQLQTGSFGEPIAIGQLNEEWLDTVEKKPNWI
jgi:hypothetical protein